MALGIDRAKADIYAAAGISEYWIVIPDTRTVEILRRPGCPLLTHDARKLLLLEPLDAVIAEHMVEVP